MNKHEAAAISIGLTAIFLGWLSPVQGYGASGLLGMPMAISKSSGTPDTCGVTTPNRHPLPKRATGNLTSAITGHRVDAPSIALRAQIDHQFDAADFQPSFLIFADTVMSISGHSSTRMLDRYTHPTLERRIAALDAFNLSTKCPQNSVQQKEAAEAVVVRSGPPSPLRGYGAAAFALILQLAGLPSRSSPERRAKAGGRQEARTPDLRVANAALSQLS